ncbi:hypothetical protein BDQ94DRAFT_132655 [Aspergillus welwitschiae]|uniref:Uncharacterized protein n=1 Tax=Aspergillus welwitschiae TaxID=1341132 RepID=A0A3F3QKJ8_9EURO|nr:hypothetical protein BDQ94DRAFT_132655 [Aspergillus welwitschiae]RDH39206.1 hypothetical protein BDQ94DRAFT_132655 [Aspergillus welwitschiae]
MFRWTHVPEARWEEMDRQPAHPFLVLLWLLTPTRSHSLPAMIRQKLKIRPEREKYASPPPLPDWGGWDQKDDTSTSSTKYLLLRIQMHRSYFIFIIFSSYCCRWNINVLFWQLVYGRQKH